MKGYFVVNVRVEFLFKCLTNTWYGLWDLDDMHMLAFIRFLDQLHQCLTQGLQFSEDDNVRVL